AAKSHGTVWGLPVNRRLHLCKLLLHMQQKFVVAGSWPRCAIWKSWELSMNRIAHSPRPQWPRNLNFVAADVRGLILFPAKEVGASLRRLLRFIAPLLSHEPGGARLRRALISPSIWRSG